MAVAINEFEIVPSPVKAEPAGRPQAPEGSSTLTPALLREIEKATHSKRQRIERLTAS